MNEEERKLLEKLRDEIEICLGLPEAGFRENKEGFTGRPYPGVDPIIVGDFLIFPKMVRYRKH